MGKIGRLHSDVRVEILEGRTLASATYPTELIGHPASEALIDTVIGQPSTSDTGSTIPSGLLYPVGTFVASPNNLDRDEPIGQTPSWEFGVQFSGPNGVNPATIVGDGLITVDVFAANVRSVSVTYLRTEPGEQPISYFRVDAPGGSWDFHDKGEYTVSIAGNRVESLDGHIAPRQYLRSFDVVEPQHASDLVTSLDGWRRPTTSLENGRRATVPVKLTNLGDRSPDVDTNVRVYLRSSELGAEPTLVGETTVKRLKMNPEQSRVVNVRVQAPNTLADGVYHFESNVSILPRNEFTTTNNPDRNGPTVTVRQGLAASPTVLKVTASNPPSARLGGRVAVTVTIEHISGRAGRYVGSVNVDPRFVTSFRGKLESGETRTHTLSVKVPWHSTWINSDGDARVYVFATSFTLPVETNPQHYSLSNDLYAA